MSNLVSVNDIMIIANNMAKSRLFGMKTPEQAFSLMMIAQAEGLHPAIAARDYHIIGDRPTLKADAMLARFQQAGGKVEWHKITDDIVSATFSHASGGSALIDWDMNRAKLAGITGNPTWRKYPRQMLRARVVSEGIRTVYPGVVVGMYTPEEIDDDDKPKKQANSYVDAECVDVTEVNQELIVDADNAAAKGTLAFREFYKNITKEQRLSLQPKIDELKQKCDEVDARIDTAEVQHA